MQGTVPWQCQHKRTQGGFFKEKTKNSSSRVRVFFLVYFFNFDYMYWVCVTPFLFNLSPSPPPSPLCPFPSSLCPFPSSPSIPSLSPFPFTPNSFLFRWTRMNLVELFSLCTYHFSLCFFFEVCRALSRGSVSRRTVMRFLRREDNEQQLWVSVFFLVYFFSFDYMYLDCVTPFLSPSPLPLCHSPSSPSIPCPLSPFPFTPPTLLFRCSWMNLV